MRKEELLQFLINTLPGRIILVLLLMTGGWLAVETFILSGEQVLYRPIDIPSETTFEIDQAGLDYTVVIGDSSRPSKSSLEYSLEDPSGNLLAYGNEMVSRKRRQFTFNVPSEGVYTLKINYPGGNGGGGHTSLTVRKGDKTVLLKALHWSPLD